MSNIEFMKASIAEPKYVEQKPYVGEAGIYVPVEPYVREGCASAYRCIMTKEMFIEAYEKYIRGVLPSNEETEVEIIRCPECGESYYMEDYSTTTALYCPDVYKDGKLVSQDQNKSTTHCTCLHCGNRFSY